jgi:hypothetical protein
MCAIKPRAGDFTQHAGETATAPDIMLLLLRTRARLRIAALLRAGDGRNGDDPCRQRGEEQWPRQRCPKAFRHAPY